MKLTLFLEGKEQIFESQKITFKRFRKATTLLKKFVKEEFLDDDYPEEEMDEAVELVTDYFGITKEQFEEGFQMTDSTDFYALFLTVLNSIQLNDGAREVETDAEGKS